MSNDLAAARIAATYGSALTALGDLLFLLYKAVSAELETPPAQFNSVRAKRREKADDANLLHTIGRAREECQASGIPFVTYDPVLNEATEVYSSLHYFQTVPCPPAVDIQAAANSDEALDLPLGYWDAHASYIRATEALALLQERMQTVINRLCNFRSSSVGAAVPEACLPTPAQAKERFAVELERAARRLEHAPELLFSDWDYNAGLNACELNRLSAALQKDRLIEKTTEPTRTLLTFRHPDPAHEPIVWTVWAASDYHTERMKDGANAKDRQPKFADTLAYLRAWGCVAKPSQSDNYNGEEQHLPQLDQVPKLVLLYLNKKRLEILTAKSIGEEADPDREMDKKTVSRCLKTLHQYGLVREDKFGWCITDTGRKFAAALRQNP